MKLGIEQYKSFLDELAKSKKVDPAEMKKKMANCGPPGVSAGAGGVSIVNWNINPKFIVDSSVWWRSKDRGQGQVQSLYHTWSMTTSFYHDFISLTKVEIACISNIVSLLVTLSTLKIYDVARPDL